MLQHPIAVQLQCCSCEINLFNNKTWSDFQMKKLTNVTLILLSHNNQWIYSTTPLHKQQLYWKDIILIDLSGSGLLTINPDCIFKHDHIQVTGRYFSSTTLPTSYTSLAEFTNLINQEFVIFKIMKADNYSSDQYSVQLNNLSSLQHNL